MRVYKDINALRSKIKRFKRNGSTVGFVPTMGFLHDGHLSLIRRARRENDVVAVSIFVNPVQFGPSEDFREYPRDLRRDLKLCRGEDVDVVFAPEARDMYPEGFSTYVNVEGLTDGLCGRSRPGHFRGVTTVVAKLFNIVMPDTAYFGQKDAQQAIVIRRMVKDLDMDVRIKVCPIIREPDGLAMSSRNTYLRPGERKSALCLYAALREARRLFYREGVDEAAVLIKRMKDLILREKSAKIDYVSVVDIDTLKDVKKVKKDTLVALAVRIGKTRLIDNTILKKKKEI